MRRFAAAGLLALVALAGCGGEEDPATTPAGAAQRRQIENLYAGRFARAYRDLHPAHQRVVSRALFTRCARRVIAVGELESVEVLDVFDDDVRIAALPERETKAVRVRVTSAAGESYTSDEHEVEVGGRWRWVLSSEAVRAYRRGSCPGT